MEDLEGIQNDGAPKKKQLYYCMTKLRSLLLPTITNSRDRRNISVPKF